jgi:hypothetical protein
VGWLVEPGFGPIDPEVVASVETAADALKRVGLFVRVYWNKAISNFHRLKILVLFSACLCG